MCVGRALIGMEIVEEHGRSLIGGVDPPTDARNTAIAHRQYRRGGPRRKHMDTNARGYIRKFLFELVPAGDLERHEGHFPRPGRRAQRLLKPPYLQNKDPTSAQICGSPDWNGADQATVEEMLPVDLDGREQSGYGT